MTFQSIYAPYIEQYLKFKRSLGFKLRDIDYIFAQFDRLAIMQGEQSIGITKELSDAWCGKWPNEKAGTRYARVSQLSLFGRFLGDIGFPSYIPEVPKFQTRDRFTPYIFSKKEISSLLIALDHFVPDRITHDSAYLMMPALLRVLYGTGIRLGEALSLKDTEVDLTGKCIAVKQSKNGTERMVPLSDSLVNTCLHYKAKKQRQIAIKSDLFFIKQNGSPCGKHTAYTAFRNALWNAGIPHKGKGLGPRLHDLRHTFACHALVAMMESGLDIYHSLPVLSTYLGHRTLESTDKYVRLTAEMFPHLLKKVNETCAYIFPDIKNKDL